MTDTTTTADDHRAEAARLAHEAERHIAHVYGKSADAHTYALLAQVHVQLAATQPPGDDPYWAQAKELEALRTAVRALWENSPRVESSDGVRRVLVDESVLDDLIAG